VWQVSKFYTERGVGTDPTLRINTGKYVPLLGRTYFEIAMEGRSQHRSQGEGRIEFHGDSFSGLTLVGATKDLHEKSIFDGLDTSLTGLAIVPSPAGEESMQIASPRLDAAARSTEKAQRGFDLQNPAKVVMDLVRAQQLLDEVLMNPEVGLRTKTAVYVHRSALKKAVSNAIGMQFDALADSETVTPGGDLMVSVKAFLPKDSTAKIGNVTLTTPNGWTVAKTDPPQQSNAAYNSREVATAGAVFNVHVAPDAEVTEPYWLRTERRSDLFEWPKTASQTLPFDPPMLVAHVTININGTDVTLDQPVQYRYADPARGEIRREINVVPPISVAVAQKLLIVPVSAQPQTRQIDAIATKNVCKSIQNDGTLTIRGNSPGWTVEPIASGGDLAKCGDKATESFRLKAPANEKPGIYTFTAQVEGTGFSWAQTMNTVAYPHIQTHRFYTPAEVNVLVLDLKTTPLNVGYVMGSGDEVPDAIREMGMNVTLLDEKALASGDLSKYDTIVVGIRASETRPDFVANNKRLLDYVNAGGNLIVQYQRGNFAGSGLLPFPANTQDRQGTAAGSIARVVDENAPVQILQPQHAIFNFPNKITADDFKGWVQERNAYNLVTFDQRYTPLLESHDAGEQPNNGGMVVANLGKGTYIYTSYSWFRQLPAGVPGAYRIFANMIALPKAASRAR
jgi:hypothetical protein